jgi:hypothetical protein
MPNQRLDTLAETISKLNMRPDGYREHLLRMAFPRRGEKVTERELLINPPPSIYGPASGYDGGPTNILGQMQAGVVQARLRERSQCYRLIIGRDWIMLVLKEDEAKWLPFSKQYRVGRDKARSVRGQTITGARY